jgi:hypothetical protein
MILPDPPFAVGDRVVVEQRPEHATQVVPGTVVELTLSRRQAVLTTYEMTPVAISGSIPGRFVPPASPVLDPNLTPRSGPVH